MSQVRAVIQERRAKPLLREAPGNDCGVYRRPAGGGAGLSAAGERRHQGQHPGGQRKNLLEYAHLLEGPEPDPVCGLQAAHWPVPRPGGRGGVRRAADGVHDQQGNNTAPLQQAAPAGADWGNCKLVLQKICQPFIEWFNHHRPVKQTPVNESNLITRCGKATDEQPNWNQVGI